MQFDAGLFYLVIAGSLAISLENQANASVISVISPFYAAKTLPHFMSSSRNETISATGSDSRRTKEAIKADRKAIARVRALYRMGKELGMF